MNQNQELLDLLAKLKTAIEERDNAGIPVSQLEPVLKEIEIAVRNLKANVNNLVASVEIYNNTFDHIVNEMDKRIDKIFNKIVNPDEEKIKKEKGWISVEDRLPEEPTANSSKYWEEYLAIRQGTIYPTVLRYAGDGEWYGNGDFYAVTHWMPIPEPPETEEARKGW